MKFILASTSKHRTAQLQSLHLEFEAIAPLWNEESFKKNRGNFKTSKKNLKNSANISTWSPAQWAQMAATQKAKSLLASHPDSIIIGGDQVASIGAHIFDKPGSSEKAFEQLKTMAGKTHQLWTALTLVYKDQVWEHIDTTHMSMRPLSEKTLRAYIQRDNPVDCAGSYKFESMGLGLFNKIQTKDPSAITGLPLIQLVDWLLKLEYPLYLQRIPRPF